MPKTCRSSSLVRNKKIDGTRRGKKGGAMSEEGRGDNDWLAEQQVIQGELEADENLTAPQDQELIKLRRTTLQLMRVLKEEP